MAIYGNGYKNRILENLNEQAELALSGNKGAHEIDHQQLEI